jgi:predicted N-acetyltransferase YhbS
MKPKNGGVKIRNAMASDAPAVSALLKELGFPSTSREVTARLKAMRTSTLVAVRENQVVGLLTTDVMKVLHRPTAIGRLSALVVSQKQRGKGVGRALVEAAEQRFKKKGCALVEVTSNLRLEDAHSFFKRLGYEATSLRFKKQLHGVQHRATDI